MNRALLAEAPCSDGSLALRLGLKPNQHVTFVDLPPDMAGLAEAANYASLELLHSGEAPAPRREVIHAFFTDGERFRTALSGLKDALRPDGALWISWPKAADGVATGLSEDLIRSEALARGLTDVKNCALSDHWSGLKLVIPVAARDAVR